MRGKYRKHPKRNIELRTLMLKNNVTQTELAKHLYISMGALQRWLSEEMDEERRLTVINGIKEIKLIKGEQYEG